MKCGCERKRHDCRLVALTGGPSAGKTAVLEVVRRAFCEHVLVLPEAASVVFGGGFPRLDDDVARRAAQRAIFHVQRELEAWAIESGQAAVALCDRGTLDALAYWPGEPEQFFAEVGSSEPAELARYDAVIHLRTPSIAAYDRSNPLRIEPHEEAVQIDERILGVWQKHPRRRVIERSPTFLAKLEGAVAAIRERVPNCCAMHPIPELQERARTKSMCA